MSPGCPARSSSPGGSRRFRLSVSVGYRTLYSPMVRAITLVHGGVSGVESPEDADALLQTLRASLGSDADVLSLPALRVGSPLHTAALAVPSALRGRFRHRSTHWALAACPTPTTSSSSRAPRRRGRTSASTGNRLLRDHGDGLSLRVYREPAEMPTSSSREIETVAALTYQRGLGVASADTDEDRRAHVELALERGWYRAWVLSLDGRPIAFWSGAGYDRTFHVGHAGLRPRVRRLLDRHVLAHARDRGPLRGRRNRPARLRLRRVRVQAPLRQRVVGGRGRADLRADVPRRPDQCHADGRSSAPRPAPKAVATKTGIARMAQTALAHGVWPRS